MFKKIFLGVFLFIFTNVPAFAQTEYFSMPLTFFKEYPSTPIEQGLPCSHPMLPEDEGKGDYIFFSTQEPNGILRVAGYDRKTGFRIRRDFMNDSGKDLANLPAGRFQFVPWVRLPFSLFAIRFKETLRNPYMWPNKPSKISEFAVRFGDVILEPYLRPSEPSGTEEFSTDFWWCHVYGNYYYAIMYRGGGESIIFENLVTEENGHDLRPILGESFEKPTDVKGVKHLSSFSGAKLSLNVYESGAPRPTMHLIPVYEKDLPEDFPKGLVRWIP